MATPPKISPNDGFVTPAKPPTTTDTTAPNPVEEFTRNMTIVGDEPYSRPKPYNPKQQGTDE